MSRFGTVTLARVQPPFLFAQAITNRLFARQKREKKTRWGPYHDSNDSYLYVCLCKSMCLTFLGVQSLSSDSHDGERRTDTCYPRVFASRNTNSSPRRRPDDISREPRDLGITVTGTHCPWGGPSSDTLSRSQESKRCTLQRRMSVGRSMERKGRIRIGWTRSACELSRVFVRLEVPTSATSRNEMDADWLRSLLRWRREGWTRACVCTRGGGDRRNQVEIYGDVVEGVRSIRSQKCEERVMRGEGER